MTRLTPERLQYIRDWSKSDSEPLHCHAMRELLEYIDHLEETDENHVAELNRRRSTDSAIRETLRECGAPDDHSLHSQIEWLAKRNVRRRRLLEQAVSELLDLHGNHSTAALNVCTGCRLIEEIRSEATLD